MWMSPLVEVDTHAKILRHLGSSGRLFAFDQDANAISNTIDDERFYPHSTEFLSM